MLYGSNDYSPEPHNGVMAVAFLGGDGLKCCRMGECMRLAMYTVFIGRKDMKIRIAYGKKGLDLELPDRVDPTVIEPRYEPGLKYPAGALREALEDPIGTLALKKLVSPEARVGIVFSDITRPTPNHIILPALLEELSAAGVPDKNIILFNSTGAHRRNTDSELRAMLGDRIAARCRIVQNDARDRESHVPLGSTGSGNEIWIQKDFMDCDVKVLTGFIEPHFFAGFSGGGKAVMPGLALLETIMRNHSVRNLDNPNSLWGITRGNPIWEEVRESSALAGPDFLLNVSLNREKEITGVFAGDPDKAHGAGCAFVKERAMAPVEDSFDIVITSNSGYPLDINLYQSVKGMSAASLVVKEGGSIIIASECSDGIPEHGAYGALLSKAKSTEELLETIRAPHFESLDMWQAQIQAQICLKADVYVYSEGLSDSEIRRSLLEPCRRIEETVVGLLGKYGKGARVCVLPEGPQTIPYLSQS